jgi:non-ribosomal peptide synthetase-like protein
MHDLNLWRGPVRPDLLRDERLNDVFTATAARLPDKTALICGNERFTYAALDALTDGWAVSLRARSIGPGSVVGVWLDRSAGLHAAILAVLKAGATFLPFDADAPAERVMTCLRDCNATLLLIDPAHRDRAAASGVAVLETTRLDEQEPVGPVQRPQGDHAAYIIYTSGSTGQPNGIAVSHRSICHLVRAENEVLGITESDVVYQGFSVAFDMALEEIFISYLVGAMMLVATTPQARSIDRLPALLRAAGVTVLHCVPTLLTMLDEDVPSLRLVNVGGEACPETLVARWWRERRRIVNTYGPTETTVTATAAELFPGEPVTIGHPLPNYTALILDEAGQPAEAGELCIGGPGVSLGYIGRPELTAERFVPFPGDQSLDFLLMYRTGDRVSRDGAGRLLIHGRLDTQVKHRGYRTELGEIEAELARLPGVRTAVVVLCDDGAHAQLAAFIVPADGRMPDPQTLRAALADRLPCYMIPASFHPLAALPQLASGKVDRAALARLEMLKLASRSAEPGEAADSTTDEAPILAAVQAVFPHRVVQPSDDFFTDLGGHSLLAAVLVSQLRKHERFACLSLQDLYALRTAQKLAARFPVQAPAAVAASEDDVAADDRVRHAICTVAQSVALIVILGLASAEFLVPYITFDAAVRRFGTLAAVGAALATFVAVPPLLMLAAVSAKWLLLGRMREGRHRLWDIYYFRWWFVSRLLALANIWMFADTPLMRALYRLLGARIGARAHLGMVTMGAPDLIEIGADASLGTGVVLDNAKVEGGWLTFGRISIGDDAMVGSGSVLELGTHVGAQGELADLSLLLKGGRVGSGEVWAGSPAERIGAAAPAAPPLVPGPMRAFAALCAFASISVLLLPTLSLVPVLPGLFAFEGLEERGTGLVDELALSPLIGFSYLLLTAAEVIGVRWLVLGRVREGTFGTSSFFFLRKWTVDRLCDLALIVLHPLYATLYVAPLFRMLGARVGRQAEISTATSVTHDLLEIGDGSFIADMVTLGDPKIRRGRITLRRTVLGQRVFLGNSALVPDGTHIPDDCLVGCLSMAPAEGLAPGQSCFGSPSIRMPCRQGSTAYDALLTHRPGSRQVAERLTVETSRVLLPRTAIFAMICIALLIFDIAAKRFGFALAIAGLPLLFAAVFSLPALTGTAALKWLLVGRYRPAEHPLWSRPVWLSEAVTAMYESLPVPLLLDHLRGTPFLPWALRLFGVRIGRRTWLDTTDVTEFDLVHVGDRAEIAYEAGPQTHLFEDRVMKMGMVSIGNRASMGARSIVLPRASLDDGARLAALSLVMKSETIGTGGRSAGSPARRVT